MKGNTDRGIRRNKMYRHTVRYYETDKMGITHHSNYIRWMEEARIAFLTERGFDYARLENEGIYSPVINISCQYIRPTTFPDDVDIDVTVKSFNGVKLTLMYKMYKADTPVCQAESMHCFLDKNGRPIRLKKEFPELFNMLTDNIKES